LPKATGSELVGEMADLLMRCEGIQRLLCTGRIGNRMAFSARTSDGGGNAVDLLGKVLDPEGGSWGGHEHRAGGSLDLTALEAGVADLEERIRSRWLEACGVEKQRGERLVPRKEILKGLD
jgi:nanoRNase/pAp phosphatase (c-di-AMP/oligoRNAs hydrolase)